MRVFQTPAIEEEAVQFAAELLSPSADRNPATNDPFAESFQDEEVVLDRYASLEAAFHGNTPRVRNRRETSWSQLLLDADQKPNGSFSLEEYREPIPLELIEECRADECPLTPTSDSEVLQIEEDLPERSKANRHVKRTDYRQLFASLRGD
jgi:hypothetical protein